MFDRKATPWAAWPRERKEEVANKYNAGASYRQLKTSSQDADGKDAQFPPESTVRGWARDVKLKGCLARAGRPSHLTLIEEDHLLTVLRFMRKRGAPIDAEFLVDMARRCVSRCRNIPIDKVPMYTRHWVKSFRRRLRLSRLRKGSTDRAPTTPAQAAADNQWRQDLEDVLSNPMA